jgi:hypothetical protein
MTPGMGYQEEASDLHVETVTYSGWWVVSAFSLVPLLIYDTVLKAKAVR